MVDLVNELEGKVAIVTGSARNIGRTTAEELARAGAAVVINALQSKDLCEEVADGIVKSGGKAIPFVADITKDEDVARMVDEAASAFGGIDILVNNAASRSNIPFVGLTLVDWEAALGAALQGSYRMSKACVPHMIARGSGSIISVGGMTSYQGGPGRAHGMASKAGLQGLTRGLAIDLGPKNIRANIVVVGAFDTDRSSSSASKSAVPEGLDIPLGRKGVPQDLANLIRFLVGPGASYISGQTIHCNGAAHMPL